MFVASMSRGVHLRVFMFALLCQPVSSAEFLKVETLATVNEIKANINFVLSGADDLEHRRLSVIERALSTAFQALPKNHHGLLERPALNYLIHRYFLKEHGWYVKGLHSSSSGNGTDLKDTDGVLIENLPSFIELFLEGRHPSGFSLQDAAVMVSTLDHLLMNEHVTLLQAAYKLRGFDDGERHNMTDVDAVLTSYRILYTLQGTLDVNLTDRRAHMKLLRRLPEVIPTWGEGTTFFTDAVQSHLHSQIHKSNLFSPPSLSFSDTWSAVSEAMRLYGTFEDIECLEMKRALTEMDPEMSGRLPLGRFYQPDPDHQSHFSESVEYLRQLGVLDESVAGINAPQLLISNYILGASNCAKDTPYYKVCCKSECEILMDQLEGSIAAPTATAEAILSLVEAMPSSAEEASHNVSEALGRALLQVSELHGGEVPLHGRLFAQWMHYAYPHECPYPHTSTAGVASISALDFQAQTGHGWKITDEEVTHYVENARGRNTVAPHMSLWNLEEELYAGAQARVSRVPSTGASWVVPALFVACIVFAIWEAATRMFRIIGQGSQISKADLLV